MISASANFLAANAPLAKKPICVLQIAGYRYAFANKDPGVLAYPILGRMGLVGAFTDGSGAVIQPLAIGSRPLTVKVPAGATQLQLGVNESQISDDSGSFIVLVNGAPVTVPATSGPWAWVNGGLNTNYHWGTSGVTSPVVAATGLVGGDVITIAYQGGTVCAGLFQPSNVQADGYPFTDSGGQPHPDTADLLDTHFMDTVLGISGVRFPTYYMGVPILPWVPSIDPIRETVSDLDGGSDLSDLIFNVQDRGQIITGDFPSFSFEGRPVVLKMGYVGMVLSDYLTPFTGKIDTVSSDAGNNEYRFVCPDIRKDLSRVIFTTGDDGFPTDSSHPRTLVGHPLDLFVDILETELGMPATSVDVAKIQQWRDTIYSGLEFEFTITDPPAAKDFIENEIMKPLGAYHRTNNLGVVTVNFFYPINPAAIATLDHDSLTELPLAQQAPLINQVVFRFDKAADSGSADFLETSVQIDGNSVLKYGASDEHAIESAGLRSAFGGSFMAAIISRLIFLRYGRKQLLFDGAPNVWTACLLEPGDIVSVTSPLEPDRDAGVMGITAKSFEILDRSLDPLAGIVTFKLLAVDLSKFKPFLITPNGEADFTADSLTNQGKYLYQSNNSDQYSDASPANTLC